MKLRIPAFLIAVVIAVPCFIAQGGGTLSSMAAAVFTARMPLRWDATS